MTQLKIHGGNMAFHKRVAILVSLSGPTGGTATFSPATGTSYSLSSLPIGSKIVKSSDSLYNITDSSNTVLGSITLTADSGYTIGGIELNSQLVSSTPVTLSDGDILNPIFNMITMRLKFYNGGLGTFYNELTGQSIPDGYYADVPRADVLRFNPSGTNDGAIEIFKDGLWIPTIIYMYSGQQAYIIAAPSSAQVQSVEFTPAPGSTYEFPSMWNLQPGYQYLDGSTFAFQNSPTPTGDLVSYSQAQIQDPAEISGRVQQALYQSYPSLQFQQWRQPTTFNYIFYDGANRYGIGVATCGYPGQNPGEIRNGEVIIPFFYDGHTTYSTPFDMNGFAMGQLPYWQDTGYYLPTSLLDTVFYMGDTSGLTQREAQWNASDVCDLGGIIYDLAKNK